MTEAPAPDRSTSSFLGWSFGWALLLALTVLLIGAVDAAFLQAAQTYFTGGFNSEQLRSAGMVLLFFAAGATLDATWVLGLWSLLLPAFARLGGSAVQAWILSGIAALAFPFALTFSVYELYRVLGNMVSIGLLWEVSGRSVGQVISELLPHLPALAYVAVPGILALLAGLYLARLAERRSPELVEKFALPLGRNVRRPFFVCLVLSCAVLILAANSSPSLWFGLKRKPSGILLTTLIEQASDFDRDGFHVLSKLADTHPFDNTIHPYAVDTPGNDIDENGLAGDHPLDFTPPSRPIGVVREPGARRPHLLMIFLESFRADLLDQQLGDEEITPFLNRFAREATSSDHAYVHSPNTASARAHLFSGSTLLRTQGTTLIDDFKQRGYFVAYFSGQDDSFMKSESFVGIERADLFFDARQAVEERSSRSTSAGGLQISWKKLNRRVFGFLEEHNFDDPLFLYVNFTDTHFPYHHDEIDNLLGVNTIARNEISSERREQVWATYANAAANVDRAIETLVEEWRAQVGDHDYAIMILADHGQSFYEQGFLGHGQSISDAQTRTPLLLWRVGGDWPEPLGIADIRGLLTRNLFALSKTQPPRARFVPDPTRRVQQVVPSSQRPILLALRGLDRTLQYDFRTGEVFVLDRRGTPLPTTPEQRDAAFVELIRTWEADRLSAEKGN